jgi:hypothetical protein
MNASVMIIDEIPENKTKSIFDEVPAYSATTAKAMIEKRHYK